MNLARFGMLVVLSGLSAFAQPAAQHPYAIQPSAVAANARFPLKAVSLRFDCGTTYSHQTAQVGTEGAAKRITLSFLPTANAANCPAVVQPYGPTFVLEALPQGAYAVYVRTLTSCMVSDPACAMAPVEEPAGTLYVGWKLGPKEAPPGDDFTLRLLSDAYGNCSTSFIDTKLELRQGTLYASFMRVQHRDRVCVTDVRPHGPSFDVQGLPAGNYPVVALMSVDASAKPPTPELVDTLRVFEGADPTALHGDRRGSRDARAPKANGVRGTIEGYRPDGRLPRP